MYYLTYKLQKKIIFTSNSPWKIHKILYTKKFSNILSQVNIYEHTIKKESTKIRKNIQFNYSN